MYLCMTYFFFRLAIKYTGRQHGSKVQPFLGFKKTKSVGKFKLTLIYMRGGGKFAPQEVFGHSSKMIGSRLLELCGYYCYASVNSMHQHPPGRPLGFCTLLLPRGRDLYLMTFPRGRVFAYP